MDKKYLIIIGAVIGLIIIGLIIFFIFRKPSTTETGPTAGGAFPAGGGKIPAETTTASGIVNPPPTIQAGQERPLVQLTQKAVSGATFIEKIQTDKTKIGMVRYFEKATGHIYDIDPLTGTATRISNTTIPNIFEVYWSPTGDKAVIRYIENNEKGVEDAVRNFSVVSLAATSTHGTFLLSAIKTIAASSNADKIFYLAPFEDEYIGITASFADDKQKQILSIPFGEFQASWIGERVIGLLTKPSSGVEGYLYKLDPTTGSFERILKGVPGLTALWSPDSEFILYGASGYNNLNLFVYNTKNKKTAPFSLTTLPEKCSWSPTKRGIIYCAASSVFPTGNYPDDWYQGVVSFSDRVWKINVVDGTTQIISSDTGNIFDFIHPFLSKNENYLFFQNKIDGTLWSLNLVQ